MQNQQGRILRNKDMQQLQYPEAHPPHLQHGFFPIQSRPPFRGSYCSNYSNNGPNQVYHGEQNNSGPRFWRPRNGGCNRYDSMRPNLNAPYPLNMTPQPWRRQNRVPHFGNMDAFPPQTAIVTSRQFETRFPSHVTFPWTPGHGRSAVHPSFIHSSVQITMQNSYQNFSHARPTFKTTEEDEQYCSEPIKRNLSYVSDSVYSNSSTGSDSGYFCDSSVADSMNDEDNDDYSKQNTLTADLSLIPSLKSVENISGTLYIPEEHSFLEIFIAASIKLVRNEEGRAEQRASVGVWLDKDSTLNFAQVLPKERPQCSKAVLIFGSGKAINVMKEKGCNRLKISMESDFIIQNVSTWIEKFMNDACKGLELTNFSNWDEYKYAVEIKQLCRAFQGMVIKWSHVHSQLGGIKGAKTVARELLTSSSPSILSMMASPNK